MRNIKFRFWDSYNEEMIVPYDSNGNIKDLSWFFQQYEDRLKADNNPKLMQYIELKDSNGNDVYEGDIIKCFQDEPGTKYYSECTKTVFYENGCLMPFYDYLVSCELHFIDNYPKFEVIGNIHDNNIKL